MPRLKEELQFANQTTNPKAPLDGVSIFNKNGTLYKIDFNGNVSELGTGGGGGDLSNYYTIPEVDERLLLKVDVATLDNYFDKNGTNSAIDAKIAALVDTAPTTLDTLNEIAAALGDDPNFAATITTELGKKANSDDVFTKLQTYDRDTIDGKIPNMDLYYLKTETYNQGEINNKFNNHVAAVIRDWSI